jgi:hypothetical protein
LKSSLSEKDSNEGIKSVLNFSDEIQNIMSCENASKRSENVERRIQRPLFASLRGSLIGTIRTGKIIVDAKCRQNKTF